jgi:WD40 repeat protein
MRVFISHSGLDSHQAAAVRKWLIERQPDLENEIFLDRDRDGGIHAGQRWKDALKQASNRCEAVICLLSASWEQRPYCTSEYLLAETLGKFIIPARLEPLTESSITDEWQRCDLFLDGRDTETIVLDTGESVQFAAEGLQRLLNGLCALGIGADFFPWPPPTDAKRTPYRGWDPLDQDDAAVFFGRDAEIGTGMDVLRGMRAQGNNTMLVIQGPSGAGKSAFLRAGLLPRLLRDDRHFLPLDVIRPERSVLTGEQGLANAIFELRRKLQLGGPEPGEIKRSCTPDHVEKLRGWLEEARERARSQLLERDLRLPAPTLVLPLDQGEELFFPSLTSEAKDFLQIVAELLTWREGVTPAMLLVVTIRADSYEPLHTAPQLAGVSSTSFNDLKEMHPGQFTEVITGPAARASKAGRRLTIEPALVKQLLEDVPTADGLPLLALTLERLHGEYGVADGDLTLAEYKQMGGVKHIVQTEVNKILGDDPEQRETNLEILHEAFIPKLASINVASGRAERRIASFDKLPPESRELIEAFVEKRLLVKGKLPNGEVSVQVALESLLRQWKELARWLRTEGQDLKFAERIRLWAADWRDGEKKDDAHLVLRGTRLTDAETLAAKEDYFSGWAEPTQDFVRACRRREDELLEIERRRQARLKAVSVIAVAVAVLALVGAGVAVYYFRDARDSKTQADNQFHAATAERLGSEAQAMLAGARPDGDFQALQRVLAMPHVYAAADQSALLDAVIGRRDMRKIIQTNADVSGVASSADGSRFATSSLDGTVRVWDSTTGLQQGNAIDSGHGGVWTVAFAGQHIVIGSTDGTVQFWDPAKGGSTDFKISTGGMPVRSLAVSPDGRYVVAGSTDGTVRVFNATTAQPQPEGPDIHVDVARHGPLQSVAVSGNTIATGSEDGTIQRWGLRDKLPVGDEMRADGGGAVWSLAFSPRGDRIAAAGGSDNVWLWNPADGTRVAIPHHGGVWTVAFNQAGDRLATGGIDDAAWVWDVSSANVIGAPLTGNRGDVKGVTFLGEGVVTVGDDGTVRIWDSPDLQPANPSTRADGDRVVGLAFPDQQIASVRADGTVYLWDATGRTADRSFKLSGGLSAPPAFGGDGTIVAAATERGTVELWSTKTGQLSRPALEVARTAITALAVGGNQVASLARGDDAIRLWDLTTGAPSDIRITVDRDTISSMTLSSDGQKLATIDRNGTLRVWETTQGTRLSDAEPVVDLDPDQNIRREARIAFSGDGGRIVSGARGDDRLREWNAVDGKLIGGEMRGHQRDVTSVGFSRDGNYVVSGAEDGTVRLWDANTQLPLGRPVAIAQPLKDGKPTTFISLFATSTAFTPDGQLIVAGLNDGTVRTWPGPAAWTENLCAKLTRVMYREEWSKWVAPAIAPVSVCPSMDLKSENDPP